MIGSADCPKQLVILSGKGGTGKTSFCSAFAMLSARSENLNPSVFADADVDAANLSLVLKPEIGDPNKFLGGSLAEINPDSCIHCGVCFQVCRYDAVIPGQKNDTPYWIDPIACDGCGACVYACPEKAIGMIQQHEGNWFRSTSPYGVLFHAELFPGRENSGKLVTLVKQQARLWAEDIQAKFVIIDGPPGIGCPVISACAGADLSLIVTEPGLSGLHDLKRVMGVLEHFHVPSVICINKADIYPEGTAQIHNFASEKGIEILGEIPFDENISLAMLMGGPITELFPNSPASIAIQKLWEKTLQIFLEQK